VVRPRLSLADLSKPKLKEDQAEQSTAGANEEQCTTMDESISKFQSMLDKRRQQIKEENRVNEEGNHGYQEDKQNDQDIKGHNKPSR
jgi:hypothetical protein